MKVFSNIRFCEFLSSSLSSYSTISSFRPLPYAHYFQTFIHVFLVLTKFVLLLFHRSFVIPPRKLPGTLPPFLLLLFYYYYYFFYNKTKNAIVPSVVMVTLLYHLFSAVLRLLRGNSDTILTAKDEIFEVNIAGLIVAA